MVMVLVLLKFGIVPIAWRFVARLMSFRFAAGEAPVFGLWFMARLSGSASPPFGSCGEASVLGLWRGSLGVPLHTLDLVARLLGRGSLGVSLHAVDLVAGPLRARVFLSSLCPP